MTILGGDTIITATLKVRETRTDGLGKMSSHMTCSQVMKLKSKPRQTDSRVVTLEYQAASHRATKPWT